MLHQVLGLTYLQHLLHRRLGDVGKVEDYCTQATCATAAQMLTYVAMARANFGWLAWRRGDLALAKEEASAARDFWQASKDTYPCNGPRFGS